MKQFILPLFMKNLKPRWVRQLPKIIQSRKDRAEIPTQVYLILQPVL